MHAKRSYYKNVFNTYSSDLKKSWQTIKESLNRRKKKQDFLQEFKLANGNLISDSKQIAEAFNDFFVNIGDTGLLNANLIADFEQYMPAKHNCSLIFQSVTVDNVNRIIDSLKPKTIGYEPADLTVHPPPQNCRGWVHFFRIGVSCSQKNVLK